MAWVLQNVTSNFPSIGSEFAPGQGVPFNFMGKFEKKISLPSQWGQIDGLSSPLFRVQISAFFL